MPLSKTTTKAFNAVQRKTHVIDAAGVPLGRVATQVSKLLIGKHRVDYAQHLDMGDAVQVKNVAAMILTGNKGDDKLYHRYSGYPGGITTIRAKKLLSETPEKMLQIAVKAMLPKNSLSSKRMKRLIFITA